MASRLDTPDSQLISQPVNQKPSQLIIKPVSQKPVSHIMDQPIPKTIASTVAHQSFNQSIKSINQSDQIFIDIKIRKSVSKLADMSIGKSTNHADTYLTLTQSFCQPVDGKPVSPTNCQPACYLAATTKAKTSLLLSSNYRSKNNHLTLILINKEKYYRKSKGAQSAKEVGRKHAITRGFVTPLGFIIIIMEICKAPTLRLKALNKHTHITYITMENVIKKKEKRVQA